MTRLGSTRLVLVFAFAACGGAESAPPTSPQSAIPITPSTPSQAIAGSGASPSPAAPVTAPPASVGNSAPASTPAGAPPSAAPAAPPSPAPADVAPGTAAVTPAMMPPAQTTDASATPPATTADPPGTVSVTTDAFDLKPGQETYKCQNFDNPFGGQDTAVQRLVTDMSKGSHHLHVYHMTTSNSRTLEDCPISDFHPLLYAAGSPHAETTYPAGMAAKVLGNAGLRIQLHYINTSSSDLSVNATLKLTPVEYSSVTKWISELYFNNLGLRVPPGLGQTVTASCTIPQTYGPIGLVFGGTHMHHRGVHFVANTSTGVTLADVDTWDEPPGIVYDPPVMLNPGDKISWTCTYDNETSRTITFGESAEDNEMCIYLARFFSAPDGAQLECQASGPNGMTTTRTY